METSETLKVTIDAEGNCKIEVIGNHGKKCAGITKDLEDSLGKVKERVLKPEHNENKITQKTEQKIINK